MDWTGIDTVLLDLDGTLLDRAFDDDFYYEILPRHYATANNISITDARSHLTALYRAVEGELDWTDLDYWTRTLRLDVPAIKASVKHGIQTHPDTMVFLNFLGQQKSSVHLVTNAHPKALAIKMAQTGLDKHLASIITAFDMGCLKMKPEYWAGCQGVLGFDPSTTLYIDDDEAALASADAHGIRHLYLRSRPSSALPAQPSATYRSIESFHELMPHPN
jgi:FMN phosphatase YigB (HAD superfamily)